MATFNDNGIGRGGRYDRASDEEEFIEPRQEELESLENGTCVQSTVALFCPCYVFAETIGHLRNRDSADSMSCCIFGSMECAGIACSNIIPPLISTAVGEPLGSIGYAIIVLINCIPHCLWVLPLSLEMRAKQSRKNWPRYDVKSILETIFCPCCVLSSVERWAKANKGKVTLKQTSNCLLPPMELVATSPPPHQLSMSG